MEHTDFNKAAKNAPQASDYVGLLEGSEDMTEAQQLELLEALFSIMESFVMMGYGIEPVDRLVSAFCNAQDDEQAVVDCDKQSQEQNKKER